VERWIIDRDFFAGDPFLALIDSSSEYYALRLSNARFPGTNIAADFWCEVKKGALGWTLDLRFLEVMRAFKRASSIGWKAGPGQRVFICLCGFASLVLQAPWICSTLLRYQ